MFAPPMMTHPHRLLSGLFSLLMASSAQAQLGVVDAPHHIVLTYPKDRDVPVAVVGMRTITLGDVIDHIGERHYPGFGKAIAEQPHVQRYLQSDLIAPWVRQLADIEALRQTFHEPPIDEEKLKAAQSEELRRCFQGHLDAEVERRRAQGRPTELSQQRINSMLADYQLRHGLGIELQGLLNHIEPGDYNVRELRDYFNANARVFGGQVTIQHILVQHRDGGTGILLNDVGIAQANAKMANIKASLRPDGSNFEEIARSFSDDIRTGKEGGLLQGVHRHDDRLPAILCRTAWSMRDGEISDVVESQYGWHLIRRLEFHQQLMILFTDDTIPSVREVMRRSKQEDRLFEARQQTNQRLRL